MLLAADTHPDGVFFKFWAGLTYEVSSGWRLIT